MDKKQLRTIGHHLNPVVTVAGGGLSDGVTAEIERALDDHELIKIKLAIEDREQRRSIAEEICSAANAELVQSIGKVVLILRKHQSPNPKTSNLVRYLTHL